MANPGIQAALLLRAQMAVGGSGHSRLARAISLANLRLTGADLRVGCQIGGGVIMRHPQGIVVGGGAVVGEDCTLLQHVTLGERYGDGRDPAHQYPRLGSRVVVGAGAVILGGIQIGDDVTIGANAVVLGDVADGDTVVGVPAKSVSAPVTRDAG